jgi:hypothetical protein
MTLRDHIAGWAEPLMKRFKELYIACENLQKDIMTYAEQQDELHQKVFGNSNLMEAMSDETLPIRWSMTLSTETQHKYLFILEKGLELNMRSSVRVSRCCKKCMTTMNPCMLN